MMNNAQIIVIYYYNIVYKKLVLILVVIMKHKSSKVNKNKKKQVNINKAQVKIPSGPTVSILTPSRYKRRNFLKILKKIIISQDYDNILEWVIVDGSPKDEQLQFKQFISDNLLIKNMRTVYVNTEEYNERPIGLLRNLSNDNSEGDILVCMDDDDFYPSCKVSTCVNALMSNKNYELAGTDRVFVYDCDFDCVFQTDALHPNNGTNNTLAYKKS